MVCFISASSFSSISFGMFFSFGGFFVVFCLFVDVNVVINFF